MKHPVFLRNASSETGKKVLGLILPYVCFVCYSVGGAWLIYAVDLATPNNSTHAVCVREHGFLGALFYINTLYTTIGYGTIVVCNDWSKVLTILLAILGIPLFVIVLDSVGKITCRLLRSAYVASQKLDRKCAHNYCPVHKFDCNENKCENDWNDKFIRVPIWIVISLDMLWVVVCAGFFHIVEQWSYLDSVYFTFISLFTIGLGDFAPKQLHAMPFSFGLLIIGLSLVSTTMNMMLLNIQALIHQLHHDIEREYQQRLQFEGENPHLAQEEYYETPEETIARLIKENGASALAGLISGAQFAQIATVAADRSSQQSVGTQTDPKAPKPLPPAKSTHSIQTDDKQFSAAECQINSTETMVDDDTQCELSIEGTAKETQTDPQATVSSCVQTSMVKLSLSSVHTVDFKPFTTTTTTTMSTSMQTAQCILKDSLTQTELLITERLSVASVTKDAAVAAHPTTRTVYLQTPNCWTGHRPSMQVPQDKKMALLK